MRDNLCTVFAKPYLDAETKLVNHDHVIFICISDQDLAISAQAAELIPIQMSMTVWFKRVKGCCGPHARDPDPSMTKIRLQTWIRIRLIA